MTHALPILKGRGTTLNPQNRFELLHVEADGDALDEALRDRSEAMCAPQTEYLKDSTRSLITTNDSPDVGFTHSVNPYRGCSHGCIYCYARPGHEYLGFSSGLDFESKVMVKLDAPRLLREELSKKGWQPTCLSFSGVTDCYQPIERRLRITRRCLEVCAEFGNPVSVITKNALVTRDIDVLSFMARNSLSIAILSITTLDPDLARVMEPRAGAPRARLEAVSKLRAAGVPVGVMLAPIIPGLTDHEIPRILDAAAGAGAMFAGYLPVRLPYAIKDLFQDWLERHFPDRKEKVLNRIRSLRGGKLNDPNFGTRMRGQGVWADQLRGVFELARRRAGLDKPSPALRVDLFKVPPGPQMALFPA